MPPEVQTWRVRPEFPCGGNAFGGSALRCCDCWMTGAARLFRKPAIRRPARPAGLRGEIKGEASAEGRRRRTFAPKRSEEHTSELQSLMRNSYAVFCLKNKRQTEAEVQNIQQRSLNKEQPI